MSFLLELERELHKEMVLVSEMERIVESALEGHLECKESNGRRYYYRVISRQGKKERLPIPAKWDGAAMLVQEMAEQTVAKRALPCQQSNLLLLERLKKEYIPFAPTNYLFGDLVGQSLYPEGQYNPWEWEEASYEQNPYFREYCVHQTQRGEAVRSKSEVLIADSLHQRGVKYRYECGLQIGEHFLYPDFTMLHPSTSQVLLWEHFGLLDEGEYASNAMEKLLLYAQQGYRLGETLIITWETASRPLTRVQIQTAMECAGL